MSGLTDTTLLTQAVPFHFKKSPLEGLGAVTSPTESSSATVALKFLFIHFEVLVSYANTWSLEGVAALTFVNSFKAKDVIYALASSVHVSAAVLLSKPDVPASPAIAVRSASRGWYVLDVTAIVGVAASPELFVIVIPVPATRF